MKLLALLASATAVQAVRLSHMQKRVTRKHAAHIEDIPRDYREASYPDEDFFATKSNDISFLEGYPEQVREGTTAFHRYEFPQHAAGWPEARYEAMVHSKYPQEVPAAYREAGYPDEDFFEPKPVDYSFMELQAAAPEPDHIVRFYKYEFDQKPSWFEASYVDDRHRPLATYDIPDSYDEAHYPDEDFFAPKEAPVDTAFVQYESEPERFSQASTYSIGIVPDSYNEALYRDQVERLGFLEAFERAMPVERGEQSETWGPKDHRHTSNVLGTRQEGRNFWTNTVQPNMKHYKSTYEEKQAAGLLDKGGAVSTTEEKEEDSPTAAPIELLCPECQKE